MIPATEEVQKSLHLGEKLILTTTATGSKWIPSTTGELHPQSRRPPFSPAETLSPQPVLEDLGTFKNSRKPPFLCRVTCKLVLTMPQQGINRYVYMGNAQKHTSNFISHLVKCLIQQMFQSLVPSCIPHQEFLETIL